MKTAIDQGIDINLKIATYVTLCCGIIGIGVIILDFGYIFGLLFSLLPLCVFAIFYCIKNPYWALTLVFGVNYFILGATRYIPGLAGGIVIDALIAFCFLTLLIRACYKNVAWERVLNSLTLLAVIWLGYCTLELLNPLMVSYKAWATSIRGVAIYFLLIVILTPIIFYRYKDLKRILYIWSVMTLLAVGKAAMQKYIGFDARELYWLYESGGSTTHIIYTGIRYFSFFTDAANYGAGMGFSMVVFSICALVFKHKKLRIYFMGVAIAAAFGMMISGTRGALAVPFAGYFLYIILSKKGHIIVLGTACLLFAFIFLNYTKIGEGNQYIRRMRSAFNMDDPSFQVRLRNQEKMRVYMKDKYIGVGLGLGGGKAKQYAPNAYMSQIPTDSWFVMIWVETGIVGLILHISILLYIVAYGIWLVMFRIKDDELKGVLSALLCGIFGIMVCSYGNEILGQFPTCIIVYMGMAFIFTGKNFDIEIEEKRTDDEHEYNTGG